jgi:hypothetical protein
MSSAGQDARLFNDLVVLPFSVALRINVLFLRHWIVIPQVHN